MKQFGRQFRLEIGDAKEGLSIDNLRVSFEFERTIDPKPNPAIISVYNLNRDHINQAINGAYKNIRLSVGYNELRLIYLGQITKTRVRRDDLDWVIEFECSDGATDYQKAYTAITMSAGANDQEILKKASESFADTKQGAIDLTNQRILPRGKVIFGNTRDVISQVCQNSNADWSIQNGELVVLPPDKVLNNEAVLLSQDTGMIGAPEATDNGLELKCLLNPSLEIGGLIRVRSILDYYNGDYKIVNLKGQGDAINGDWLNTLIVVGGKFQKVEKK